MTTFTVHHKERNARAILRDADTLEFVKDGFAWLALVFPAIWFLAHRLWLVLVFYIALLAAISFVGDLAGLSDFVISTIGIAVNLLAGFEGNNLRRWTLRRRGFFEIALVTGSGLAQAERRYFEALVEAADLEPAKPVSSTGPSEPSPPPRPAPKAITASPAAMFPAPGGPA